MRSLFSAVEDRLGSHGALLLRLTIALALIVRGLGVHNGGTIQTVAPQVIAAALGLLILIGLWTPFAGAAVAIIELFLMLSHSADPWLSVLLASLSLSIALLGPGAWSIDARRLGLKRIEIRRLDET